MIERPWTIAWIDGLPHYATCWSKAWHLVDLSTHTNISVPGRILGTLNNHLVVAQEQRIAIMTYPDLRSLRIVNFEHHISSSAGCGKTIRFVANGQLWTLEGNQIRLLDAGRPDETFKEVWYNPNCECFFTSSLQPDGQLIRGWGKHSTELLLENREVIAAVAGWSDGELVLRLSQHLVTWDFVNNEVNCQFDQGSLSLRSQQRRVTFTYEFDHTQFVDTGKPTTRLSLACKVETVLFLNNTLVAIGHSTSQPLLLSIIDLKTGTLNTVGSPPHTLSTKIQPGTPPLLIVRGVTDHSTNGLFFLPGGPHQIAGNAWDPLVYFFASQGYTVAIPQYYGVLGTVDRAEGMDHYGLRDVTEVRNGYEIFKQAYPHSPILGHSYGCYLGLQVMTACTSPLFVGLNGVYDLETAAELCPNTFQGLSSEILKLRSTPPASISGQKWCHLSSKSDPIIQNDDFKRSLQRIHPAAPGQLRTVAFDGHAVNSLHSAGTVFRSFKNVATSLGV